MIGKYLGKALRAVRNTGSFVYKAFSKANKLACQTLAFVADAYEARNDAMAYDAIVAEAGANGMTPEAYVTERQLSTLGEQVRGLEATLAGNNLF